MSPTQFTWQRIKPPGYATASILVSLGGLLNGLDTGSIGGIASMEQFSDTFGTISPTMKGFTVSLIMLAGVLPSLFTGQLADRFGHLPIVALGAIMYAAGCVLQGAAYQLSMFHVGRFLAGFGQGMWLGNVSVYICEIAPATKRGMLVSAPQLLTALGICLGYFTCYGTVRVASSMAWRAPYITQGLIATVLAISCFCLPKSPRWLVLHNRREEAMLEIERLDIHREEAEKDILRVSDGEQNRLSKGFLDSLLMPFAKAYRSQTILALFVLGMVQLSGIDGVLYYAPVLFQQAGLPEQTAGFLASGLSSILVLAISIPAMIFADKWGRRVSVITGGILLSGCMLLIGSLYAADQIHAYGAARWVVIVSIFVFALTYASTWGIVGRIVASEIQPARTRAGANCAAQSLSFLANWLVAFSTPVFLAASSSGPYFLFGFLALGTVATLAAIQPETRGQPLESIHASLQRPIGNNWKQLVRRVLDFWQSTGRSIDDGSSHNTPEPSVASASGSQNGSALELASFASVSGSTLHVEAAAA